MSESKKDFKPVTVEKPIPVEYDLGNLAVFDPNPVDPSQLSSESTFNSYLDSLTRDNAQLIINQILSLPVRTSTESNTTDSTTSASITLVQLPTPITKLPREKSLPKPKPPTKWEQFAARKGIKKKGKDGKLVYDEEAQEWAPKWGYGGKNKQLDDQWLVEVDDKVKDTTDELIDPRSLSRLDRKKLIKKNELQHKRNLKKSEGR